MPSVHIEWQVPGVKRQLKGSFEEEEYFTSTKREWRSSFGLAITCGVFRARARTRSSESEWRYFTYMKREQTDRVEINPTRVRPEYLIREIKTEIKGVHRELSGIIRYVRRNRNKDVK